MSTYAFSQPEKWNGWLSTPPPWNEVVEVWNPKADPLCKKPFPMLARVLREDADTTGWLWRRREPVAARCPDCGTPDGIPHAAGCPRRGDTRICPVSSNPCHSPIHCGAVGCWRQKPVPWGPGATQERDMSESTNETVMADTGPVAVKPADTGAGTLLREAAAIVDGKRTDGAPERVLQAIGSYWACYLRNERARVGEALAIGPAQVADMLALMKLARAQHGVSPVDSSVDMAGYAALAGEARAVKP